MQSLIGDIGNTETKICILNKKFKIIKKIRLETSDLNKITYLRKKFSFIKNKKEFNKKALFANVVTKKYKNLKKFLKKSYDISCRELKQTKYYDLIKIKVNKKQIGSDRIANAIGSKYLYKTNCIILDFGTATTFDVVKKGIYYGGVIAPGVKLSLNNLVKTANQIPFFKLKKINKVIGNNTVSALRSGFYLGYSGLINNILNLIIKETKFKYKIILTGGLANLFKNSITSKVIIDKDITIKGLIYLLKSKKV